MEMSLGWEQLQKSHILSFAAIKFWGQKPFLDKIVAKSLELKAEGTELLKSREFIN